MYKNRQYWSVERGASNETINMQMKHIKTDEIERIDGGEGNELGSLPKGKEKKRGGGRCGC